MELAPRWNTASSTKRNVAGVGIHLQRGQERGRPAGKLIIVIANISDRKRASERYLFPKPVSGRY